MNEPDWSEADNWYLLRDLAARVYTRLYKPTYDCYPVWTVRFVLEHDATVGLDPTLTLEEAKAVATMLSIARRKT